jgi:UDP-N-acetylmuramoyl-L-alanyl-D-glutamate--2,6-diaminopimelate ligase
LLSDLSKTNNTTPDAVVLHGLLAEYLAKKTKVVAMEVSSHGLDQGRVNGVNLDVAVFTNLTRDHLDYHGDMQAYGEAKKKLFTWPGLKTAVINRDDSFGLSPAAELSALGT